jgi:hypothetical protein
VPTINLADDELSALTAAIRRAIEDDRFPHAPRLDPLRGGAVNLAAEGPAGGKDGQADADDNLANAPGR